MIDANQHRAVVKAIHQENRLWIHPGQAGKLAARSFSCAEELSTKRLAGDEQTRQGCTLVTIELMCFAYVRENEAGSTNGQLSQALIDPGLVNF